MFDNAKSLNKFDPTGAIPSIILNESVKAAQKGQYLKETIASSLQCGNGNVGSGFPGERMVNNPSQDSSAYPHITQSETSIARFGTYIVFGFNDSNEFAQNNYSGIAFSSDSGVTWSDCGDLPKGTFQGLFGDPVIASDSNGIFYYGCLATTDAGESVISVSTAEVISNILNVNTPITVGQGSVSGFQDKEWIAVGPDKNISGNESLYVTWTDFFASNTNAIRFAKFSTGPNPTVQIASKIIVPSLTPGFNGVQGSFVVVDNLGNIYVFYTAFDPNIPFPSNRSIKMVKSTDGGLTFSEPITVASPVISASTSILDCGRPAIFVEGGRMIRMNEFPHAAVDSDRNLYVVWNGGTDATLTGTSDINVFLSYSTDGGATWNQVSVTTTSTHEFFPSVIYNCGEAHVQYSRFNDPQNVGGVGNKTFALFKKSFSILNGLSDESMVSTVFSPVPITNPNFDTVIADCYMGDYNQIIAGPGSTLYHAWGDNRFMLNSTNNPDVFFIQTNCKEITRGINYKSFKIL